MSKRSQVSQLKLQGQTAPAHGQAQGHTGRALVQTSSAQQEQPLPRPERRPHRARADRGLPPDDELGRLATAYLQNQRKLWPELVKTELLPDIDDQAIATMVEDFKNRHRAGQVEPSAVRVYCKICSKLGGCYNRYSCDNSSPTSILDQMVHGLERARQEDRFVPWSYVFADYSVTGMDSSRQGYSSYKKLLGDKDHLIETTYVDDFTRASRDEVEWWKLAQQSKRLQKRMIGASDGFDLSTPNWDVHITLYGLLSRLFLKGLREKVRRGMRGAARRGTCLGRQSLGFTRSASRDDQGNIVRAPDGQPKYRPCIDPTTAPDRKLMYELFLEKHWSPYQITKHFNQFKVDGWDGWTERAIKQLLWSPTAIDVFVWNKTRREYDFEEEKWVVVKAPRSQWEVYYEPALALISLEKWRATRKRLSAMRRKCPITGRKRSRNHNSASTLFSGTLLCGYCGRELMLYRSAGPYKVMGCLHGPTGKFGCQLTTSKSTRIIEKCLLGFLSEKLLTEATIDTLVVRANAFLAEEAHRPRTNLSPLKSALRQKEATIKRLFERLEGQKEEALCQAYEKRIADLQKDANQLRTDLRHAEVLNVTPPPSLDVTAVKAYLADLRALLNQETPAAAEAIRAITGPITIRQEKVPGKRGGRWIATLSPNLLAIVRHIAKQKDCPDSITLEYLTARNWIRPEIIELPIDHVPKYEQIACQVAGLANKGASVSTIASALGQTWETVDQALKFSSIGQRPMTKPPGKRTGKGDPRRKQVDVAEVARLRDEQLMSFKKIARRLGVCEQTVVRAYDQARPQAVREAAQQGKIPERGSYSHLGTEVFAKIEEGLRSGQQPRQI